MINKTEFVAHLRAQFATKIERLQDEIHQLRLDMSSDTKSTAGDKHETGRAMVQLEMEKLGNQILDYQKQLHLIKQLQLKNTSTDTISSGALIQLNTGWFFLGLGIGKIPFEHTEIFCISAQSPLGQKLLNKRIGEQIDLPNLNSRIVAIY